MRPLLGQRVVDITQNVAGPYCTQILADLGAEVIKIERPGAGDDTRHWTPLAGPGISASYATLNRGKKSLALDLNSVEGQSLLVGLLRPEDVVIHSLKPGSAEQRGIGYEALSVGRPGLVYCAISAFGNLGSMASLPGYDPLIQAYAGIMSVNGHDGAPPARVGVSMVDMGTGMWSALGIVAALLLRKETGRGTRIDTSLLETGIGWMTNPIANYSISGELPKRMGSGTTMVTPYEIFETSDSHVFVGCGNDRLFNNMAQAIGHPELSADPRFTTNAARVANRSALEPVLGGILRTMTTEAVVTRLRAHGVPVSGVQNIEQILTDPQVQALGMHRALPLARPGAPNTVAQAVGLPIRFGGEREFNGHISVKPGEDSRQALRDAGLSDKVIDDLAARGVIQV
jgi:crotonobetainyl-CoA:carnitine CoA-transferase CaiB-like acyl-CoA transferase